MKTIAVSVFQSTTGVVVLSAIEHLWVNDEIKETNTLIEEHFKDVGAALTKAICVNYEYEQRMDNLTGGNDE